MENDAYQIGGNAVSCALNQHLKQKSAVCGQDAYQMGGRIMCSKRLNLAEVRNLKYSQQQQ